MQSSCREYSSVEVCKSLTGRGLVPGTGTMRGLALVTRRCRWWQVQWTSVPTTWENYLKSQCPAHSNAVMYCAPRSICIRTSLQSPNTKLRPILHSNRDKHIQVFTPPPLSNPAKVLIKIRVGFSSPQLRASKIRIREFGNIGTSNVESCSARHT